MSPEVTTSYDTPQAAALFGRQSPVRILEVNEAPDRRRAVVLLAATSEEGPIHDIFCFKSSRGWESLSFPGGDEGINWHPFPAPDAPDIEDPPGVLRFFGRKPAERDLTIRWLGMEAVFAKGLRHFLVVNWDVPAS